MQAATCKRQAAAAAAAAAQQQQQQQLRSSSKSSEDALAVVRAFILLAYLHRCSCQSPTAEIKRKQIAEDTAVSLLKTSRRYQQVGISFDGKQLKQLN